MSKKILVIDDSKIVQNQIGIFASILKYDCICCNNLSMGIKMAEKGYFDAILLDLRLGNCNVTDFDIEIFSKTTKKLILMSADFCSYTKFDFLQKPFTVHDLEKLLNT